MDAITQAIMNVATWQARYDISKRALALHIEDGGTTGDDTGRMMVGRINDAGMRLNEARLNLTRARAGLPPTFED